METFVLNWEAKQTLQNYTANTYPALLFSLLSLPTGSWDLFLKLHYSGFSWTRWCMCALLRRYVPMDVTWMVPHGSSVWHQRAPYKTVDRALQLHHSAQLHKKPSSEAEQVISVQLLFVLFWLVSWHKMSRVTVTVISSHSCDEMVGPFSCFVLGGEETESLGKPCWALVASCSLLEKTQLFSSTGTISWLVA